MQTVYFVNAFVTHKALSGNPAAVCLLDEWLPDTTLQAVAEQHNLSETVYLVNMGANRYTIRWFTPLTEVNLCGHATLAAAHILFEYFDIAGDSLYFESASGELSVTRNHPLALSSNALTLNFPARPFHQTTISGDLKAQYLTAFGLPNATIFSNGQHSIIACDNAQTVHDFTPNINAISQLPAHTHYLTAASTYCDFVCRVFAPNLGIPEDPVTGSAYTSLAPFWAAQLNKTQLHALQLSARGGHIDIALNSDRVLISGAARTAIIGQWMLEPNDEL